MMKNICGLNVLFIFFLAGCSSGGKDLDVTVKKNNLCFFTNDLDTEYSYDNDLLLSFGKVDFTKQFVTDFEKSFSGHALPIKEKNCLELSADKFKKNTVYQVTLETNKIYHALICIRNDNNQLVVKKVEAGKTTCPAD